MNTLRTLHLGIFLGNLLDLILIGEKTLESRITRNKIVPFNKIKKGDLVLLKLSSGPIVGIIEIGNVTFLNSHNNSEFFTIKEDHGYELCTDDEFWERKKDARYATLMEIKEVHEFSSPIAITIPNNRKSWIVLGDTLKPSFDEMEYRLRENIEITSLII